MIMRNLATAVIVATVLTSSQWTAHADPYPRAPAYATALDPTTTTIKPFLTVGDSLPLSHGTGKYLVVGIPDGLGLYRKGEHVILLRDMATRTYEEYLRTPEDEHRVWYVGATRTKEQLTIVAPRSRNQYEL